MQLQRITDVIPHIILTLDPCGVPLYANQTILEYTGLTSGEVVTPGFHERISHPEYRWFLIRYNPFRDELCH